MIQHASYYLLKSFNDKGDAIGRIFVCIGVGQQQRIELSQQSSNSHLPTHHSGRIMKLRATIIQKRKENCLSN